MKRLTLTAQDDGTLTLPKPLPLVAFISDRDCKRLQFKPMDYGYRPFKYIPYMAAGGYLYARPWVIWVLLYAKEQCANRFWQVMTWLYRKGVLHVYGDDCRVFRWRDIRLGPEKERKT